MAIYLFILQLLSLRYNNLKPTENCQNDILKNLLLSSKFGVILYMSKKYQIRWKHLPVENLSFFRINIKNYSILKNES